MKSKIVEANLAMLLSKVFGGLNINALSYLLPLWIAPVTGVSIRLCFGAAAFWLFGIFAKPDTTPVRDRWMLFFLGMFGISSFMYTYLLGLSMTTPVSAGIFTSMQPSWVFVLSAIFLKEKVTFIKLLGLVLGFGGAILCIVSQPSDDLASNALLGNILCMTSSLAYAVYLIWGGNLLKRVPSLTLLQYTFLGGAMISLVINSFVGFDAPIFHEGTPWMPIAILVFVLIFPTTISYMLLPIGLKYLNVTLVSAYGYLLLAVSAIVSLVLGQDRFSWTQLFSIVLICVSVYLVEIAENKKK